MIARKAAAVRLYPATDTGKIDGSPVFMSPEYLTYKSVRMSPAIFSAQMLLDPVAEETAYFKKGDVRYYDEVPKHVYVYGASDYAVTEDDGDWTEHGVIGINPDDDMYVLDWWRGQKETDVWIEAQLDLAVTHEPLWWFGDSASGEYGARTPPCGSADPKPKYPWCHRPKRHAANSLDASASHP